MERVQGRYYTTLPDVQARPLKREARCARAAPSDNVRTEVGAMRTSASFCLLWLSACAASGGDPRDGGPIDAVVVRPDAMTETPECAGDGDCPDGFVCAAVAGVPRCVPDPDPPPPGDGTDCRPCPSPGECRMDICIQPTPSGMWCEFDDECMDDELCIAGRCTPDPRIPVPCTSDADCPAALHCSDT